MLQSFLADALVAGCAAYAGWSLLPAAGRRWLAAGVATWPLPQTLRARLAAQRGKAAGGCGGCAGCASDKTASASTTISPSSASTRPITVTVAPIVFHRRRG